MVQEFTDHSVLNFIRIILLVFLSLFLFDYGNAVTAIIATKAEKQAYQAKLDALKTFVHSAAEYLHKYGAAKAYKEFSNPKGRFRQGDLYLFVYNYNGTNLVHGADPKLVGVNLLNYRDLYGTAAFKLNAKMAKLGGGFIHYYWPKPGGNDIEYKTGYVEPLDANTFIGAGLYENIEAPLSFEIKIEELKSLVHLAKDYYQKKGKEVALAEFNNPKGKFHEGSQYIFVASNTGLVLAHGGDPNNIGKNLLDIRDEFGTPFMRMFIEAINTGGGVVSYYWPNPETGAIELKISYVEPLTKDTFIGSGFYNK